MELLRQILSLEFLTNPAAIASLLLLILLFLFWYRFADLKKLDVPGPKPLPILGNILELYKYGGLHPMLFDYVKKYGKMFAVYLGDRPTLVVADPELVKQIMIKDFPNFRNRFITQKSRPPLDKNVLNAKNDAWKRIRSTLTPTFSAGKMKLMVPLINTSCNMLVEKLDRVANSDQSVDMLDWFNKLTLEVILATAFGVDAKIQTGENSKMVEKAQELFRVPPIVRMITRLPFGNLLLGMLAALGGKQDYFPDIAKEIIKSRRQQGLTGRKDLLQLMMNAHDETTGEGVSRLTDEEIVAQSVVFLLAGFDTSSNTLAFTLYYLVVNPDVQEKLRSEIKEFMEQNRDKPLYEIIQNIEYLDCVIKEGQRLCPTAPQVNRECDKDYDLNGIHIPAGTEIIIPIYALHRDPEAWKDPEKFDPERFRGLAKDAHHPFCFLPFGAGPRNCIGMRFALMEIKIVLVKILMKYKFARSSETQIPLEIHTGLTLSPKGGVMVKVFTI